MITFGGELEKLCFCLNKANLAVGYWPLAQNSELFFFSKKILYLCRIIEAKGNPVRIRNYTRSCKFCNS